MMLEQTIKSLSKYRFSIFYKQDLGRLILDFEPIVEALGLGGNIALIHWQAKPRGQRRWGIFSSDRSPYRESEAYAGYRSFQGFRQEDGLPCQGFQLDESQAVTVPTAVIVFKGVQVLDKGSFAEIVRR